MNILHINTDNAIGGAGRAASRLHIGLKQMGQISRMLVRTKSGTSEDIQPFPRAGLLGYMMEYFLKRYYLHGSLHYIYFPSSKALLHHSWFREADVINLHNIHGNYFAYTILPDLTRNKPVVWTMHDMWGFTGHCSYSFACMRWKIGCGQCPDWEIYPRIRHDTTHFIWKLKFRTYQRSQLMIITPSAWLLELVHSSPLLSHFQVMCIPNSINTQIFHPSNRKAARESLGLPGDDFLLLFIAAKLHDPRKGGHLLITTLNKLADRGYFPNLAIVMIGEGSNAWEKQIPFPVYNLGVVKEDITLASCYSAADLLILPTQMDNLPNTMLESMACGTPCIAFNIGGIPDAIHHLETGYLAQANNTDDLAQGICTLYHNLDLLEKCRLNSRVVAVQEFSQSVQARRYLDVYESMIRI